MMLREIANVDESADEIENIEKIDFKKREERIQDQRVEAMREVLEQRGVVGLLELAERGNAAWTIGVLAVMRDLLTENESVELLSLAFKRVLEANDDANVFKNIVSGALRATADDKKRSRLIKAIAANLLEADLPPVDSRTVLSGDLEVRRYTASKGPGRILGKGRARLDPPIGHREQ